MTRPEPTRKAHEAFCVNEGWEERPETDHVRYRLILADGRRLYTRISRPVDRSGYGQDLWRREILGKQLQVTEAVFWACARDGVKPVRIKVPEVPENALPAKLVQFLSGTVGLSDAEIAPLTEDEARARALEYWSNP